MKRVDARHYPLVVSAAHGEMASCGVETCGAWASGTLIIFKKPGDGFSASTILTSSGCELCPLTGIRRGDVNKSINHEEGASTASYPELHDEQLPIAIEKIGSFVSPLFVADRADATSDDNPLAP